MNHRERVLNAIEFKPTDRVPKDLAGMASTGISCFAYPKLVEALGLPPRRPRVYDQWQMLAFPDVDVLDALGVDTVTIWGTLSNALGQTRKWHDYDFNGRLKAKVRRPRDFSVLPDGTIKQRDGHTMVTHAHVFNVEHAGQSLDFMNSDELPFLDLKKLRRDLKKKLPKPKEIKELASVCRQVRETTDRAIFYSGPGTAEIGIGAIAGIGVFPVMCLVDPDYVAEYQDIMTQQTIHKMELVFPEIGEYIDILMLGGDDWGTQHGLIASPETFQTLFLPYYKRMNDAAHRILPDLKTFMHSCGAVYELIDDFVECGFDILNPVQWTAGNHGYREWKDKARGRVCLWGGGVNIQVTMTHGTVDDVEREAAEITEYLSQDSGYVFNGIHNILAEVAPEKIIAMYRAAGQVAVG